MKVSPRYSISTSSIASECQCSVQTADPLKVGANLRSHQPSFSACELHPGKFKQIYDFRAGDAANLQLIKPTLKRWIILLLFCLNAGNKSFQWIQVPALTLKATVLYNVDNYAINASSVMFMLSFIVLSWPACYIIEMFGVRKAVLAASFGTMVGSFIKCFSCHADGIWLLMIAQALVSLSEQLIFSIPTRLASVWFPDSEVSSAVAITVFGCQLGVALGFIVPQWFLGDAESQQEIAAGYFNMFATTCAISVIIFILCLTIFSEEPEHAPGQARLRQRELERAVKREQHSISMSKLLVDNMSNLFNQIGTVLTNGHLVMLSLSYGITSGFVYSLETLLDQMIGPSWPGDPTVTGNTGFLILISGVVILPVWGRIMDKWHRYKLINLLMTAGLALSLLLFTYVVLFTRSVWGVYAAAILFGSFSAGIIVVGLEQAVELTYPAPELVTSSVMNVPPNVFGVLFVFSGSYIVDNFGLVATSGYFIAFLTLALVLLVASRERLNRQEAVRKGEIS